MVLIGVIIPDAAWPGCRESAMPGRQGHQGPPAAGPVSLTRRGLVLLVSGRCKPAPNRRRRYTDTESSRSKKER